MLAINNNTATRFENPFKEILFGIFAYTIYGVVVETPPEKRGRMHTAEIANFAYEKKHHGNFIYTDSTNYKLFRLDAYNTFVIENRNLYGTNLGLKFRFLKRFDAKVNYLYLKENNKNINDHFSMFSGFINYHRIRTQKLDAWFGLGVMHAASNVNRSGFAVNLGAEWFIKKPVSIYASHKFTNINSLHLNSTKLLLKYYIKNYNLTTGYEQFVIGVSKVNTFSLGVGASF